MSWSRSARRSASGRREVLGVEEVGVEQAGHQDPFVAAHGAVGFGEAVAGDEEAVHQLPRGVVHGEVALGGSSSPLPAPRGGVGGTRPGSGLRPR